MRFRLYPLFFMMYINEMDHLQAPNQLEEILSTPDALDVDGAKEIKLTDSTGFVDALRASTNTDEPMPEVYEWRTTKLPEREIMPMSSVKDVATSLIQRVNTDKALFEAGVSENDIQEIMTLDDYRAKLIEGNSRYKELFRKAPRLFRMIVSGKCTPQNVSHIMDLIQLRAHQESAGQTQKEKEQQVSAYFRANFMRKAREGEEEEAVRTGKGFRGTPMTAEQVKEDLRNKKQ